MESFHPTHFTGFWAHLFTPRLEHRLALFLLGGRCPFQSSDVAGKTVSWELWEILVKSTAPEDERLGRLVDVVSLQGGPLPVVTRVK